MPFEHTLTVRFFEIDRAGIAFFGRFFEYCHVAYEELLASTSGNLESFFGESTWGTPVVRAESDFRAPAHVGERLVVQVELDRVGGKSVTFAYRIVGEDGVLRARILLTHAIVDFETFKSRDVPQEFLDALVGAGLRLPSTSDPSV